MKYLLLALTLTACTQQEKSKEIPYSLNDIMVIFENGYQKGALNAYQNNFSDSIHKVDTTWFKEYIGSLYK